MILLWDIQADGAERTRNSLDVAELDTPIGCGWGIVYFVSVNRTSARVADLKLRFYF